MKNSKSSPRVLPAVAISLLVVIHISLQVRSVFFQSEYSSTNDPEYIQLRTQLGEVILKRKEMQLEGYKNKLTSFDSQTQLFSQLEAKKLTLEMDLAQIQRIFRNSGLFERKEVRDLFPANETTSTISTPVTIANFENSLCGEVAPRGALQCGRKTGISPFVFEASPDTESFTCNYTATYYCKNFQNRVSQLERRRTIKTLLKSLASFLELNRVPYWISHGTLLGSRRDRSIIPWDQDGDLALDYNGVEKLISILSNRPKTNFGCDDCSLVVRTGSTSHTTAFRFINTTNGVYLNVYMFTRFDVGVKTKRFLLKWRGWCQTCDENGFKIEVANVYPLQKACQIDEDLYYCPAKIDKYLTSWYGPSWTTPVQ